MLKAMNPLRVPLWLGAALVASSLLASCDDGGCSDDEKVAIQLHINNPDDLKIKVTAELAQEEECPFFFDPGSGRVYTCYEQGGGSYKVRVYTDDQVIYEDDIEVEADKCHVKALVEAYVDLTGLAPAP
jgi:hypothetical protein